MDNNTNKLTDNLHLKLVIYNENESDLFSEKTTTWIGKIPSSVILTNKERGERR